jgi:hypothetical protein
MLISIIITLIAGITWRRLIQQSLQFYRLRTSTMFVLIWLSIIWVMSIISFPHLYTLLTDQSRTSPLTTQSTLSYLWYMMIIWTMISLVVFYRADGQISIHQVLIIGILAIIGVVLPQWWRYPLYYYLIAAGVEEYVKYYIWLGSYKLYWVVASDIVLFGLLSGLWFACIENVVYLNSMAQSNSLVVSNLMRWIAGPIIHMVYSGWLAYGYWYLYRRGRGIWWVVISALIITLVHTWYNGLLSQWWRIPAIITIIIWYAAVSRMLYQCDRLYFDTKNNLKIVQQ